MSPKLDLDHSAVFSDSVLHDQTTAVLDRAAQGAVTINRAEDSFVLLPRQGAAQLIASSAGLSVLVELLHAVVQVTSSGTLPPEHAYSWIQAFDGEELAGMIRELDGARQAALVNPAEWDEFDAILHEWHESSLALQSQELVQAFAAPPDHVPLTPPRSHER